MFCNYRTLFGEVNTGLHSYRLFDIAVVDVIMTTFVAWIIHYFILMGKYSVWLVLAVLFLFGILVHRIFCVRTTVDKWLFGSPV